MILFLVILFGLAFGSFVSVLTIRVMKEESIITPGSYCPHCKKPIKPWHNIPLISFLILRGKCYYCAERISIFYPLIEILSAILFVSVYLKTGIGFNFIFVSFTFLFLLSLSIIDLNTKMAPDSLNLLAFCMALLSALFGSSSFFETPITPFLLLLRVQDAFSMSGFLLFLKFSVEYFLKKEALGEADIIVVGTMGALLGLKFAMLALFFSAVFSIIPSLIYRKSGEEQTPFIPFLSLGTFVVYLFGPQIDMLLKTYYAF
jgi:leader peptidase (prepilin peptidase)/N-methyltransferase